MTGSKIQKIRLTAPPKIFQAAHMRLRYAVLAGLGGGLLCSAKIAGPVYAAALGVSFGVALFLGKSEFSARRSLKEITRTTSLMLAVAGVTAASWYIRNLIYFHNPFYPKKITVLGKMIFAGPLDNSFFGPITIGFDFFRLFSYWKQFVNELGVGLPLLVIVPLLVLVVFCRDGGWHKYGGFFAWLVLLPLLLLLTYLIQPFSLLPVGTNSWEVQPRFLLCFLACLDVSMGFLLSVDRQYTRLGLPVVVLATIVNVARWSHYWWLVITLAVLMAIAAPFLVKAFGLLFATAHQIKRHLGVITVLIFFGSVAGCYGMDRFRERRKDYPEYGYADISPGWGRICSYVRHITSAISDSFLWAAPRFSPCTVPVTQTGCIPRMKAT